MDNPQHPDPSQELPPPHEEKLLAGPPASKPRRKLNWKLFFLAIIVVILVDLGAWQLLQTEADLKLLGVSEPTKTATQPSPLPTVQPTTDPTADWKTYTHPEYNYSFQYPNSMRIVDILPHKITLTDMGLDPNTINPTEESILVHGKSGMTEGTPNIYKRFIAYIEQMPSYTTIDPMDKRWIVGKINGVNSYQTKNIYTKDGHTGILINTHLVKEPYKRQFSVTALYNRDNNDYEQIYNQILSTFTFTE